MNTEVYAAAVEVVNEWQSVGFNGERLSRAIMALDRALERAQAPSFGQRLRSARLAKGWSQQALATRLGVGRLAVLRWEAGRQMPSYAARRAIALRLGAKILSPEAWDS